jgi:jouberin
MKSLSVKAVKPPVSPGNTPQKVPLRERSQGGNDSQRGSLDRGAFRKMLRGSAAESATSSASEAEGDSPAAARPTGAGALRRLGSSVSFGAAMNASSFARKMRGRARTGKSDDEDLPPYDASGLFEEGQTALDRLDGQLTSVTVHGTDELPHDWRIAHPLMSVHVVNGYTGQPLRKSNIDRAAVTPHERVGAADAPLEHIQPVLTKPFQLRGASGRLPSWEEELVLGEAFTHLLHPRVYLLFELLDFAPDQPRDAGLEPFAWGFLKMISGPMAAPAHANALRPMPLRIQLYGWQKRVRTQLGQPAVWSQYLAAGRRHYGNSSTAYITVRPLQPPEQLTVRFPHRPMAPHHVEEGRLSFEKLQADTARDRAMPTAPGGVSASINSPGGGGEANWMTATFARGGGPCLLPNTLLHALPGGALGATAVALSPDGQLVAVGLAEADYSMVAIHDVHGGRRREAFHAHHRTIHELCWSADGQRVVSVSADGTAKVWKPRRGPDEETPQDDEPLATMQHPSYVYCVRTQPKLGAPKPGGGGGGGSLVITGANDNALRLWDVVGERAELLATKKVHKARINALAWPSEGNIFSADGAGVVKHWEVEGRMGGGGGGDLKLISSIEKKELRDVPINSITLHPNRRRLLLQTRGHQLLALDTRLQHFSARYQGHKVGDYHIRATYSPDGRFVVAGSADGRFYAWAEENGNLLLDGLAVGFSGPLLQISWSAVHDTIAMCGYGADNPALLYFCDPQAAAQNTLLAAAAAAAASTAVSNAPNVLTEPRLTSSVDSSTGAGLDGSTNAADRAQQRDARKAARRAANPPGGGSTGGGGLFPSELGGGEQANLRKAAAAERRSRENSREVGK